MSLWFCPVAVTHHKPCSAQQNHHRAQPHNNQLNGWWSVCWLAGSLWSGIVKKDNRNTYMWQIGNQPTRRCEEDDDDGYCLPAKGLAQFRCLPNPEHIHRHSNYSSIHFLVHQPQSVYASPELISPSDC